MKYEKATERGVEVNPSTLDGRIDRLRLKAISDGREVRQEFNKALAEWNANLEAVVEERFGSKVWYSVPVWHKFVGSTPGEGEVVHEAAQEYITEEIEDFVTQWEEKLEVV